MEEISLGVVQVNTLITALSFVDIPETFDHEIEIIDLRHKATDGDSLGVQCQFFLVKDGVKYEYLFFIGYYNNSRKNNPQSIALWRLGPFGKTLEIFGNIGYVTDKLREYKVW
jgi:hypothetical protein